MSLGALYDTPLHNVTFIVYILQVKIIIFRLIFFKSRLILYFLCLLALVVHE